MDSMQKIYHFESEGLKAHYTASFDGCNHRYHGDIIVVKTTKNNVKSKVDSVVSVVKSDLVKRMKRWGFEPKDLTKFIVYYFDNKEEVNIFEYER